MPKLESECFSRSPSLLQVWIFGWTWHITLSLSVLGGSVPTVPILVFPSSSAPNQLSTVAIIPSATSSCSTIAPFAMAGRSTFGPQLIPPVPLGQSSSLPMQLQQSIESPVSAAAVEGSGEIMPSVSLALSALGICSEDWFTRL